MSSLLPPVDEFNARWMRLVRPADWTPPGPTEPYHLVVIGAGTAGLVTAAGAAGLGARVALIERERLGGDCLNVGCVPSKALLAAARVSATVRHAGEFGVRGVESATVDFPAVMERLRRLRAEIAPNDSAERFRSLGVDVFFGDGRFTGDDRIDVAGQTLRFRRAVIATGARAAQPTEYGLREAGYLTNETVFSLTELPQRLAVLGGGPIGCELGQAFARLGSQVTLLERGSRILAKEEPAAAEAISTALKQDGVTLLTNAVLQGVERSANRKRLTVLVGGSKTKTIEVDDILVAAGRTPNVTDLGLERVGVQFDPQTGVVVDDHLRTSIPRIFACGDVCSAQKFTHAADFQARIVVQNALFGGRARASRLVIPRCTYTSPEVAHVGLTETEAKDCGIAVDVYQQDLSHVDRAILSGHTDGFVRAIVRRGTDRLLGGTIVTEDAGEMIGEFTLALTHGLSLRQLGSTIHPYPTVAEAIRRLGDHYNRTRLTPFVARFLKTLITWRS